jgi:hypothetical protein
MKFSQVRTTRKTLQINKEELIILLTTEQNICEEYSASMKKALREQGDIKIHSDNLDSILITWREVTR